MVSQIANIRLASLLREPQVDRSLTKTAFQTRMTQLKDYGRMTYNNFDKFCKTVSINSFIELTNVRRQMILGGQANSNFDSCMLVRKLVLVEIAKRMYLPFVIAY